MIYRLNILYVDGHNYLKTTLSTLNDKEHNIYIVQFLFYCLQLCCKYINVQINIIYMFFFSSEQ